MNEAANLVNGDRQRAYGSPRQNWTRTANLFNAYLGDILTRPLTAEEAATLMILVKVARQAHRFTEDNLIDIEGYAKVVRMIHVEEV